MQDDRIRASLANSTVRLFRLVNRVHNRKFKTIGISAEQAHVLSILGVEGALPIGRLQRLLALSGPTLTGAIDRLEAEGLVRRRARQTDLRVSIVEPRVSAKRQAQIEAVVEDGEQQCFAALTAAERKELGRLMEKAIAGLEPIAGDA